MMEKNVYTTLMGKKHIYYSDGKNHVYTTLTGVCPRDRGMVKKIKTNNRKEQTKKEQSLSICIKKSSIQVFLTFCFKAGTSVRIMNAS